jgi:cytochrome c oxidase subunit 3
MTTNKSSSTRLIPTYWYNMIQHGFFISVFSAPIQRHTMHVVPISPWPIVTAFSIMFLLTTTVGFFRYVPFSSSLIFLCLFLFISSLLLWGSDVILEGTLLRMHTLLMQRSFVFAVILFILSEVMFFFSFFWSFFHYSLSPSVFIYCVWPPIGISIISPWGIPFLNTIILLSSGVSLTVAHRAFLSNRFITASVYLFYTIVLGLLFTLCQLFEYMNCSFSINDSVYGSIFFLMTGFHGLHVIVGTVFLILTLFRLQCETFEVSFFSTYHIGFDLAAWYWHFVDVVWLFLFSAVYWWGS